MFPDGDFDADVDTGDATSLSNEYIQKWLTLAAPMFNVARWGALYSEGLAMYVADRIQTGKARKARGLTQVDSGNVASKSVGPVSVSFDSQILNKQADDNLMGTPYGRRYCELRDMVGLGGTACEE